MNIEEGSRGEIGVEVEVGIEEGIVTGTAVGIADTLGSLAGWW